MLAAKKKAPEKKAPDRVSIMGLKGTREYREWLDGLVAETSIPLTRIVRWALEDWAEARDLAAPPEGEVGRPTSPRRRKGGA